MLDISYVLPKVSSTSCLGYSLFSDTLDDLPQDKKILVNTINQYSFCMAEQDNDFKNALKNSDVLLPDGVGIVAAAKFLNGSIIKKITGADLHQHLLNNLQRKGGRCFYLGSSTSTLAKIKERLNREYPAINADFYSPPYKKDFSAEENEQMITAINKFKPDVIFIGMTAPKQEKWAFDNKDKLNGRLICSIGAVFDFYAGTIKRPHPIWINMGLEWFGRMIKEPRRLYIRYLYYGPIFAMKLLSEKVKS